VPAGAGPGADGTGPSAPHAVQPALDHAAVRRALDGARAEAARRLGGLTGSFDELVAASRDSNADDEHDPEGATIAFERSQLDLYVSRARAGLAEIDAARDRLDLGRYGLCEACGCAVPAGRLEALPTTRTCVACAPRGGGGRRPGR